jgi:hypothetical protein
MIQLAGLYPCKLPGLWLYLFSHNFKHEPCHCTWQVLLLLLLLYSTAGLAAKVIAAAGHYSRC